MSNDKSKGQLIKAKGFEEIIIVFAENKEDSILYFYKDTKQKVSTGTRVGIISTKDDVDMTILDENITFTNE